MLNHCKELLLQRIEIPSSGWGKVPCLICFDRLDYKATRDLIFLLFFLPHSKLSKLLPNEAKRGSSKFCNSNIHVLLRYLNNLGAVPTGTCTLILPG